MTSFGVNTSCLLFTSSAKEGVSRKKNRDRRSLFTTTFFSSGFVAYAMSVKEANNESATSSCSSAIGTKLLADMLILRILVFILIFVFIIGLRAMIRDVQFFGSAGLHLLKAESSDPHRLVS